MGYYWKLREFCILTSVFAKIEKSVIKQICNFPGFGNKLIENVSYTLYVWLYFVGIMNFNNKQIIFSVLSFLAAPIRFLWNLLKLLLYNWLFKFLSLKIVPKFYHLNICFFVLFCLVCFNSHFLYSERAFWLLRMKLLEGSMKLKSYYKCVRKNYPIKDSDGKFDRSRANLLTQGFSKICNVITVFVVEQIDKWFFFWCSN